VPELQFKGKEFVYNHHLTVPFRPLEIDATKGIGAPALDGNLIIHGDNLHALKALLPTHAGLIDCIYIDPPYNTGNEGWAYNDNVNSPMIREWLAANPIGLDDGLRHDKWACMMLPRLRLLRDLLADDGAIFISIDDNEVATLKALCDDIFGAENFVATFIWRKVDSPNDNKVPITPDHEYILCYCRDKSAVAFSRLVAPSILDAYPNRDDDGRLFRDRLIKKNGRNSLRSDRPTMFFPIEGPDGVAVYPIHENGEEACWAMGEAGVERHRQAGTLIWKQREKGGAIVWEPYSREYAPDHPERPYPTIWADMPTMRQAKAMLRDIFGTADLFDTPKPTGLILRLVDLLNRPDGIYLDSFAGSGTTAHAVLAANARDGGKRRFILVEGEDYADTLTAERVRRVINGYSFTGTQREELLREPLSFSKLRNANALLEKVQGIETLDGPKYDRIKSTVKDGALIVTGERDVAETTPGLGGTFTYCTLGQPIEMDAILSGEALPSLDAMAGLLWHTATAQPFDPAAMTPAPDIGDGAVRLGEFAGRAYWLFYRDDLDWLKSGEAALSLTKARAIAATAPGNHLIFAPAKFVSRDLLAREGLDVEYAPLPFALYRLETA
jgi:adenine-specific DNA-methyltransferase